MNDSGYFLSYLGDSGTWAWILPLWILASNCDFYRTCRYHSAFLSNLCFSLRCGWGLLSALGIFLTPTPLQDGWAASASANTLTSGFEWHIDLCCYFMNLVRLRAAMCDARSCHFTTRWAKPVLHKKMPRGRREVHSYSGFILTSTSQVDIPQDLCVL